jgi:hypothetical protein
MGDVLGNIFSGCVGGFRYLRNLGFQGTALLALEVIYTWLILAHEAVYCRHECSSWCVSFIPSFARNIHFLQLHFYQHDETRIDGPTYPAYDNEYSNSIITIRCILTLRTFCIPFTFRRITQMYPLSLYHHSL